LQGSVDQVLITSRPGGRDRCCADRDLPRRCARLDFPELLAGQRWYVVHTQPHREVRAEGQLCAQHFRTFLPRCLKTVRHARRLRSTLAPFFPGYLFVALDLERDRWRSVNGTFGVTRLVMAAEAPAPVPPGAVESLAAACGADGCLQPTAFAVGDSVRVRAGPFTDLVGRLVRMDGGGRVQILLQLLGGEVPVSIEREALMPARAA
jgi:transcription elongation factor/antiterminator RfaH